MSSAISYNTLSYIAMASFSVNGTGLLIKSLSCFIASLASSGRSLAETPQSLSFVGSLTALIIFSIYSINNVHGSVSSMRSSFFSKWLSSSA